MTTHIERMKACLNGQRGRADHPEVPITPAAARRGASCWPLISHAGALGLPARIGLEDTTTGPYGEAVTGNGELVRLALTTWRSAAAR
jgi:uncharacterized protein (DUF849 family)